METRAATGSGGPDGGCPPAEQLAAYVDGRLDPRERAALIDHLDACRSCREVVAEAARFAEEEAAKPAIVLPFRGRRLAAVALPLAAAAALGAFVLWLRPGGPERPSTQAQLASPSPAGRGTLGPASPVADDVDRLLEGAGPTRLAQALDGDAPTSYGFAASGTLPTLEARLGAVEVELAAARRAGATEAAEALDARAQTLRGRLATTSRDPRARELGRRLAAARLAAALHEASFFAEPAQRAALHATEGLSLPRPASEKLASAARLLEQGPPSDAAGWARLERAYRETLLLLQ